MTARSRIQTHGLEPGLHPRLDGHDTRAALGDIDAWRARAHLSIDRILAPGLAAEIAAFAPQLQRAPHWEHRFAQLSWRSRVLMPEVMEPQYPACMYRLDHLMTVALPRLISALVEKPLVAAAPGTIDIHVFCKGSYRDGQPAEHASESSTDATDHPADNAEVGLILGLTGARWPDAWGGHLAFDHARDPRTHPLGWDTLHIFDTRQPVRIPLITRHVQGIAIMGLLVQPTPAPSPGGDT